MGMPKKPRQNKKQDAKLTPTPSVKSPHAFPVTSFGCGGAGDTPIRLLGGGGQAGETDGTKPQFGQTAAPSGHGARQLGQILIGSAMNEPRCGETPQTRQLHGKEAEPGEAGSLRPGQPAHRRRSLPKEFD